MRIERVVDILAGNTEALKMVSALALFSCLASPAPEVRLGETNADTLAAPALRAVIPGKVEIPMGDGKPQKLK